MGNWRQQADDFKSLKGAVRDEDTECLKWVLQSPFIFLVFYRDDDSPSPTR